MATQQTNVTTAKSLEAGIIGLGKLGAKMTRMVLAMKLLQTLAALGIGIGEIENMAMKRKIQREIKCGNKDNLGNVKGDREYVKNQLEIRIHETKADFEDARSAFRKERARLISSHRSDTLKTRLRNGLRRIDKQNNRIYLEDSCKHEQKVRNLKRK